MKRISKILLALMLGLTSVVAGCSDDLSYKMDEPEMKGIFLRVPSPENVFHGSRAFEGGGSEALTSETQINDLYIFVFSNTGSKNLYKSENILESLKPVEMHNEASTPYKYYDLTEWFGTEEATLTFNIYLVANLGNFTADNTWMTPANESVFLKKMLQFKNETTYLLNREAIETSGLPMACLNSDVEVTMGNQTKKGEGITIAPGGSATIHADLKYLCSKVRYTILFDSSNNGISEIFGDNGLNISGATASSLNGASQSIGSDANEADENDYFNLTSIQLCGVQYPENPGSYPSASYNGKDQRFINLPKLSTPTGNTRAWQGTVYLPANSDLNKPTTLTFNGELDGTNVNKTKVTYSLPLVPGSTMRALEAGHYYDIVAKANSLESLTLQDVNIMTWEPVQLPYTLMQNVYLQVNPVEIKKVEAGKDYQIVYDSSVAKVDFISPKYTSSDGQEVDVYHIEKRNVNGQTVAVVALNADIESGWFDDIRNNHDAGSSIVKDFKWIEVQAGGGIINKKIAIGELDIHRYLTISPTTLFVNVNSEVASGHYESNPETSYFEVETNVDKFWIELDTWAGLSNDASNHIWITDENNLTVPFVAKGGTPGVGDYIDNGTGVRKFIVHYEGLNAGYPLWESAKSFRIRVKVDNTGVSDDDYVPTQDFGVEVAATRDNYVIHFKSKDNWCGAPPHIYIYQCLETPATFDKVKDGISLKKYPVGTNSNNSAALEYSFTGKIAFKGWNYSENAASLNTAVSSLSWSGVNGSKDFIIFPGDWKESTSSRYNRDMDFFDTYRNDASRMKCGDCRTSPNAGWPGIQMEDEGNGWFKIELTGLAEEGRALMIWSNGHTNPGSQYPHAAGIRLFSYPSKEAWFYCEEDNIDNPRNRWYKTKAEAESGHGEDEFSWTSTTGDIYFTNPNNWATPKIYAWKNGGSSVTGSYPGYTMTKVTINGTNYWKATISTTADRVVFNNNGATAVGTNKTGDITIDNSTNVYNMSGSAGNPIK